MRYVEVFGKVILSFLVTNWIYSELVIFFPPIHQVARDFVRTVRIPTHNEWPEIRRSPKAHFLAAKVDGVIEGSPLRAFFSAAGVTDPAVRSAWSRRQELERTGYTDAFQAGGGRSFFTGREIFLKSYDELPANVRWVKLS